MSQTRSRGQVAVLAANGGVVGVLVVLVSVLALVVAPPAPPGIAAFAPEASKAITKAPDAQSSAFGDGDGACAEGQDCTSATTTPTTVPPTAVTLPDGTPVTTKPGKAKGVPSSLQCYEWPDGSITQTFDPQSPPCIASWDEEKGNGGATSPGVTASEIRVAFPKWSVAQNWPLAKPMVDFLNSRFQLYGRKITVIPFTSQQANKQAGGTGLNDPTLQRADAAAIAEMGVFASLDFVDPLDHSWSLPTWRDTLSDKKIITISGGDNMPYGTEAQLAAKAPYQWSYQPTFDSLMKNFGEVVCKQLAGKPASHAGDAPLRSVPRKFAMFIPVESNLGGPLPGINDLLNRMQGCGLDRPEVVSFDNTAGNASAQAAKMNQLRQQGITSIIFFPFTGGANNYNPLTSANTVGFHPEWVVLGHTQNFTAQHWGQPAGETSQYFGVGAWNKTQPTEQEMSFQAFVAGGGDPSLPGNSLNQPRAIYQELLLLASGIQMAGPNLTPQTFAEGLRTTTFPNPGAGKAPFYQGKVGFGPGDPSMMEDFTSFWFDPAYSSQQASSDNSGGYNFTKAYCYTGRGRRFSLGTWPTADTFYSQGTCR